MSSRDQLSGITLRSRPVKYNEIRQFGAAQMNGSHKGHMRNYPRLVNFERLSSTTSSSILARTL